MTWKEVQMESAGPVAIVRIARPGVMNALDLPVLAELHEAFEHVVHSDAAAVVLTGKGRAFCAGGDVSAMARAADPGTFLDDLARGIHRVVFDVLESPRPVVAAVNGPAVGAGLGMMLAADLKVASRSAELSTGFLNVGLAPGCGTWLLAAHLPYSTAMEMLLTSRRVGAEEALRLGLFNEVVDGDAVEARAVEVAARLSEKPTTAMARAKSLMQRAYRAQARDHFDLERRYLSASGATGEFREGVTAFAEKRRPRFRAGD